MTRKELVKALRSGVLALALSFALVADCFSQQGTLGLPERTCAGVASRRCTNPDFNVTSNPYWHAQKDTLNSPPSTITLTQSQLVDLDLDGADVGIDWTEYCSAPEGYTGTGTRVITTASAHPAGLSTASSRTTGTPTAVESKILTLTCTLDGAGTANQDITLDVINPDIIAPSVPVDFGCGPTDGTSQTEITCTWDASTDASGILNYLVRYASSQSACETGTSTLFETSTDTTAVHSGLSAGTTNWYKIRARDNSAAQNLSDFNACVSATTAGGGGGSSGIGSVLDDSFDTGTLDTVLWQESETSGCARTYPTTTPYEGSRYLRSTLTANPPNGGNYRCELNGKGVGEGTPIPSTRYYGFAFRVPSDFANDTDAGDTILQLHYGAGSGGHYAVRIDNNQVQWEAQGTAAGGSGNLFTLVKATWTSVCIKVDWSNTSSGAYKVWQNPTAEGNTPARQVSGIITVPSGGTAGKFKIGLYKSPWRTNNFPSPFNSATSPRVIEHDDVRVGVSFAEACG